MKLASPLDLTKNEIRNARFQNLAVAPANPAVGQFYFDTVLGMFRVWDGAAWISGGDAATLGGHNAAYFLDRANHTGAQAIATVTGLQAALDAKLAAAQVGVAGGAASLDGTGKIPAAQLPAIAISDTFVVASQAAMLALAAQTGDVAVRSDTSTSWILAGADPTVLGNWTLLATPADAVLSVNGATGVVLVTPASIGAIATGARGAANGVASLDAASLVPVAQIPASIARTAIVPTVVGFNVGDAAATNFALAHNLNTRDVFVQVRETAAPYGVVLVDTEMTDVNTVTLRFGVAPAAGAYRALITGIAA